MPTRHNKKYKKSRRGGANECERLPFSRLSYDDLHSNYQKYCMNSNPLKNMLNSNCCKTLKNKFPDIDSNHYSPSVIKNFIFKTKVNHKNKDGIQKVLTTLTKTLTSFRVKTNKDRQTYGIVDFEFANKDIATNTGVSSPTSLRL